MFEYHPFTSLFPPACMVAQASVPPAGEGLDSPRRAGSPDEIGAQGSGWGRLRSSSPLRHELGLALVRFGFGVSLALAHGVPKLTNAEGFVGNLARGGFPAPSVLGWAAISSELVGGLLLALGLLTRPAAAFVLVTLAVAAFHVHGSDPYARKELALAYVLVALAALFAGPGRFSLDSWIGSRRTALRGSAPLPAPRTG